MYNHQLDAFLQVADLKSFAKAAEALYISTPAVIQQINLLESHCGFKLFIRSNRGVKLTPAGLSLYEDAKTLIRASNDMLAKAARYAEASCNTVRIAMALLYKNRLLPELIMQAKEINPELEFELIPLQEPIQQGRLLDGLGTQYDLFEGSYGSISWKSKSRFLQLARVPVGCAMSRHHHLAGREKITMEDLNGEHLIILVEGISSEWDDIRREIERAVPDAHIIDSSFYRLDTFALCETKSYVLITKSVHRDIHNDLVTIPLETYLTIPHGLTYALNPTDATTKFLEIVKEISKKKDYSLR